jgi:hypothetical protein
MGKLLAIRLLSIFIETMRDRNLLEYIFLPVRSFGSEVYSIVLKISLSFLCSG